MPTFLVKNFKKELCERGQKVNQELVETILDILTIRITKKGQMYGKNTDT